MGTQRCLARALFATVALTASAMAFATSSSLESQKSLFDFKPSCSSWGPERAYSFASFVDKHQTIKGVAYPRHYRPMFRGLARRYSREMNFGKAVRAVLGDPSAFMSSHAHTQLTRYLQKELMRDAATTVALYLESENQIPAADKIHKCIANLPDRATMLAEATYGAAEIMQNIFMNYQKRGQIKSRYLDSEDTANNVDWSTEPGVQFESVSPHMGRGELVFASYDLWLATNPRYSEGFTAAFWESTPRSFDSNYLNYLYHGGNWLSWPREHLDRDETIRAIGVPAQDFMGAEDTKLNVSVIRHTLTSGGIVAVFTEPGFFKSQYADFNKSITPWEKWRAKPVALGFAMICSKLAGDTCHVPDEVKDHFVLKPSPPGLLLKLAQSVNATPVVGNRRVRFFETSGKPIELRGGEGRAIRVLSLLYPNTERPALAAMIGESCDGLFTCDVKFTVARFNDPAPKVPKRFDILWDCGGDGLTRASGMVNVGEHDVGSSRVDLQACKLEYSIVSPK